MLNTGFKSRLLDDILYRVSDCTVEEAVNILNDLSYAGDLYVGSTRLNLDEYVATFSCGMLAEFLDKITFRGGPTGNAYYEGTLQSVVTDWVLQCCVNWGSESVAFVLGLTNG